MVFFIAIGVLLGGAYLAVQNPILFTFYWGIFGSSYDACGIMSWLESGFGYYRICMNAILLLCCVGSTVRYYKHPQNKMSRSYMTLAQLFMLGIMISQMFIFVMEGIGFINFSYGFIEYGPTLLIIWLANYERQGNPDGTRMKLFAYVIIQIVIAWTIMGTKSKGLSTLDAICGSNYISDGYAYNNNILRNIVGLPLMLVNKYLYNGLGQFHNGNDMGFYGAVGILVGVILIKEKKKIWQKIAGGILIYFSILMWGNSGMRGPIVGVVCGLIFSFILYRRPSKWVTGVLALMIVAAFLISETGLDLINYLIPESSNISYNEREILRENGFHYLQSNWLLGAGGALGNLTVNRIDPHELPLRISCLFGIFTGAISAILIYIRPIMDLIRNRYSDLFVVTSYTIVFFVSITNNYTCIALFYFLFSEAVCRMCYKPDQRSYEDRGIRNEIATCTSR